MEYDPATIINNFQLHATAWVNLKHILWKKEARHKGVQAV